MLSSCISCRRRKRGNNSPLSDLWQFVRTSEEYFFLPGEKCGGKLGCGDEGIIHLMLKFTTVKSTDCPRTGPSRTKAESFRVIEQEG